MSPRLAILFLHYILSTWLITVDADFEHLNEVLFVRFLHYQVTHFQLFYLALFRTESLYVQPTLTELCSTFLKMEYLHKLFGIFLHAKFVSFPSIYYSVVYLYQYADGYLFYTLRYNPLLFYFIAQIFPALVIGSCFSWLLCPFDILLSLWVGFLMLLLFLFLLVCFCFVLSTFWLSRSISCSSSSCELISEKGKYINIKISKLWKSTSQGNLVGQWSEKGTQLSNKGNKN